MSAITDEPGSAPAGAPLARLFIAAPLPDAVVDALRTARPAFERAGVQGLRWIDPSGIHLTLKFLGDTPLDRCPAIEAAMQQALRGVHPLALRLHGYGLFGGRRPRVLWAGLDGDLAGLAALAARLDAALAARGFPADARPFRPHLTLARVRPDPPPRDLQRLQAALQAVAAPPPLALPVSSLALVRSHLGRGGARYETLVAASP